MTMGLGLDRKYVAADSYAELKEKLAKVMTLNGKEFKVLGMDTVLKITKIIYKYPSGKTFVESF